jgi:tetratricopeptide (TPR) repeat protein
MPPLNRPVDKDGFPLPVTFDGPTREPKKRGGQAAWLVRALLLVSAMGLIIGAGIKAIGPDHIADFYRQRSADRFDNNDLEGALADIERATAWKPDSINLLYQRAFLREKVHDLDGSLDDYNRILELNSTHVAALASRSSVHQRLERHREAIDDVTRAIQLSHNNNHMLLNHRAYTRAIANLELEEALVDIQQAIDLVGRDEAAYLDTRGYIYYLLDRHDEALKDLDRAVQLAALHRKQELQTAAARRYSRGRVARLEKRHNEHEAVMVYHRGLVHEQLGNTEQAEADKRRGLDLGFNPAEGVY